METTTPIVVTDSKFAMSEKEVSGISSQDVHGSDSKYLEFTFTSAEWESSPDVDVTVTVYSSRDGGTTWVPFTAGKTKSGKLIPAQEPPFTVRPACAFWTSVRAPEPRGDKFRVEIETSKPLKIGYTANIT